MKRISILLLINLFAFTVFGQNDIIQRSPNIVLILIDDAGLMDLGAFGGEAATPNIDALAHQGLMFTNYHTSPVCAPSRAMLLTGVDSHLTGVPNIPEFLTEEQQQLPGYQGILNNKVKTIGTLLKGAGYRTYISGKWHLGHTETSLPSQRGFDRTFILDASGGDNYDNKGYLPSKSRVEWHQDGKIVPLPEDFYSSKTYVDKMIEFMEEDQNKDKPFFAYIPFQAVHLPVQAPKEFVAKYKETYNKGWAELREKRFEKAKQLGMVPQDMALGKMLPELRKWDEVSEEEKKLAINDMAIHAAMLDAMDYHIGRYIDYLKSNDLFDDTVFVITSDNGPEGGYPPGYSIVKYWMKWQGYHRNPDHCDEKAYYGAIGTEFASATASPFAFFKTYAGEGGMRVPLILSGKNIPQGQETAFTMVTDITPTILEMAGADIGKLQLEVPFTGKSLNPLIKNDAEYIYAEDEPIGFESAGSCTLYKGDWKIMKNARPYGDRIWRLYNIANDPGETKDLAKENPQLFKQMISDYESYTIKYAVIDMGDDYQAHEVVLNKAIRKVINTILPWLLGLVFIVIGINFWRKLEKN